MIPLVDTFLITTTISAILFTKKKTMASIYYAILKEFKQKWERRYPQRIFTPRPQHFKQVKDLLTPVDGFEPLELAEIVQRIEIYLKNNFYTVCAHNFSTFCKNFDLFIPPPPQRPAAAVACQRCGEIYRVNQQHRCGIIGDGLRKDKPPIPLNALLPK